MGAVLNSARDAAAASETQFAAHRAEPRKEVAQRLNRLVVLAMVQAGSWFARKKARACARSCLFNIGGACTRSSPLALVLRAAAELVEELVAR